MSGRSALGCMRCKQPLGSAFWGSGGPFLKRGQGLVFVKGPRVLRLKAGGQGFGAQGLLEGAMLSHTHPRVDSKGCTGDC